MAFRLMKLSPHVGKELTFTYIDPDGLTDGPNESMKVMSSTTCRLNCMVFIGQSAVV